MKGMREGEGREGKREGRVALWLEVEEIGMKEGKGTKRDKERVRHKRENGRKGKDRVRGGNCGGQKGGLGSVREETN